MIRFMSYAQRASASAGRLFEILDRKPSVPENILLKCHQSITVEDPLKFPIQVRQKREIFGSEKCDDES
jgi:ABC-type multidrug transport system fused ATPase/permease subunit